MALPKCRCVYGIVNEKNGKMYIGSTDNLRKRSYEHKSKLKNGYHRNAFLQEDYDKYGKENFEFQVLEKVDKNKKLSKVEHQYVEGEKANRDKLYNIWGVLG